MNNKLPTSSPKALYNMLTGDIPRCSGWHYEMSALVTFGHTFQKLRDIFTDTDMTVTALYNYYCFVLFKFRIFILIIA